MIHGSSPCGLPHSDFHGSTLARNSPWLFAACRVLLRRLMPRHPPYALSTLTFLYFLYPYLSKNNLLNVLGGGERDRTDDLLLAKQALSQLSYTPLIMGLIGVEPMTSPLSGVRSNQLSYRPTHRASHRYGERKPGDRSPGSPLLSK